MPLVFMLDTKRTINYTRTMTQETNDSSSEDTLFQLSLQVMLYDTDCGGVVHNLAYLRWVEECRTKMATARGMNYLELMKKNIFTVIVRQEVDYHFPATIHDGIIIDCKVESIEKSSLWLIFYIKRASDGKKLVTVRQRSALISMPSGRPQRFPKEWGLHKEA